MVGESRPQVNVGIAKRHDLDLLGFSFMMEFLIVEARLLDIVSQVLVVGQKVLDRLVLFAMTAACSAKPQMDIKCLLKRFLTAQVFF